MSVRRSSRRGYAYMSKTPMWRTGVSTASFAASGIGDDDFIGLDDAEWVEPSYDPDEESPEDDNLLSLTSLGDVDPENVLAAITSICDAYLSDIENDFIWLMREGRRPVEISRILRIAECEVVRLRRNCFRKIKTVYLYDFHHDKQAFFRDVIPMLELKPKQVRIFSMFYSYYGLRQIAETISTTPGNVHRSLQMMRRKMEALLPSESPHRFYLQAFNDFKYLCLALKANPPEPGAMSSTSGGAS
jgi:hypothetical protein